MEKNPLQKTNHKKNIAAVCNHAVFVILIMGAGVEKMKLMSANLLNPYLQILETQLFKSIPQITQ